ncbi:MAG TPA: PEP-CTERM sorting domain-containing protein [Gemmatimonadaceae bacterium]|nr:PEP-CTERM sorting domain-containing protein [Gemmatimonadaceae bacterium]
MRMQAMAVALLLASIGASAQAQVTTVYDNDFESAVNPPGAAGTWSTGALYTRSGNTSLGMGSRGFFLSESPTLSFTGLDSFSGGQVMFRVLLWDTWDPGSPHCCGPDKVGFRINGGTLLLDSDFGPGDFGDRAFDFTFLIPAGSGDLSLEWLGSTTQTDESWSLDNVNVQLDFDAQQSVTPEPATYALMATGLVGIGAVARRRRRRS